MKQQIRVVALFVSSVFFQCALGHDTAPCSIADIQASTVLLDCLTAADIDPTKVLTGDIASNTTDLFNLCEQEECTSIESNLPECTIHDVHLSSYFSTFTSLCSNSTNETEDASTSDSGSDASKDGSNDNSAGNTLYPLAVVSGFMAAMSIYLF